MADNHHIDLNNTFTGLYKETGTDLTKEYIEDVEIRRYDSSGSGTITQQKALVAAGSLTCQGALATQGAATTTDGVGTIGADGTLVAEHGIGNKMHVTELTFTKSAAVTAAALSWGADLYDFPASKRILILGMTIDGYVQSTGAGGAVGDVGEVGVGILVGSGANATLAAVGATAENIITGTAHTAVAADTSGVADINTAAGGTQILAAGQTLFANVAGTWSGVDDVAFVGTARICWVELD